jgi:trimeric autotransporter adhesin
MKKALINIVAFTFLSVTSVAQVAISSGSTLPDASAMLDVKSTLKGMLIPRMTIAQRNAIANPATGLMIYQTDNSPGLYCNTGTGGVPVWTAAGALPAWGFTGNAGTNPAIHFIGTTDNVPLMFRVNNQPGGKIDQLLFNTSLGYHSLLSNTTGIYNTADGARSLYSNTTGTGNSANGLQALMMNVSGNYNTANGTNALYSNRAGSTATAVGAGAMYFSNSNLTSFDNTNVAVGFEALRGSADAAANTGNWNTATGYQSLWSNAAGIHNTASGHGSLFANTTGNFNTANGSYSLYTNTTGNNNSAYGFGALWANTTGYDNTANGYQALYSNTTGISNTANGYYALYSNTTGANNTSVGYAAGTGTTDGQNNTYIGANASGTPGLNNATAIGADALVTQSNSLVLGNNVNVGIGTTNPYGTLNVIGNSNIIGNFENTSTFGGGIGVSAISENNPNGIGVWGKGVSAGVSGLSNFAGAGSRFGLDGNASNGTSYNYGVHGSADGGISAYGIFGSASGGGTNWAGYFNGNVYSTGTYQGSDRKLKNDIKPLRGALLIINQLMPSVYTYKTYEYKQMHLSEGLHYGLIADEVLQVMPGAVKKAVQPAQYENHNEHSGKKLSDEVEFNAVNYTEVIPILIGGIKEQQAIITILQKQIDELKKLVEKLLKQ